LNAVSAADRLTPLETSTTGKIAHEERVRSGKDQRTE